MSALPNVEPEPTSTSQLEICGKHAELASPEDIFAGIRVAVEIFERNGLEPKSCWDALNKLKNDEPLSREEAMMCVVWDEAEEAAFKVVTLGWLSRDVDIRLSVTQSDAA